MFQFYDYAIHCMIIHCYITRADSILSVAFAGAICIALSLAVISKSLDLSDSERKLKDFLEDHSLDHQIKSCAARLIQNGECTVQFSGLIEYNILSRTLEHTYCIYFNKNKSNSRIVKWSAAWHIHKIRRSREGRCTITSLSLLRAERTRIGLARKLVQLVRRSEQLRVEDPLLDKNNQQRDFRSGHQAGQSGGESQWRVKVQQELSARLDAIEGKLDRLFEVLNSK